jgi:hypothetical protein
LNILIYIDYLVDQIANPLLTAQISMNPSNELVNEFQRVSKHLSVIPCFDGIKRLPDTTFPKIDTLAFTCYNKVDLDILKCELLDILILNYFLVWEQHEWPVAKLIIEGSEQHNLDCRMFNRLR